MNAAGVEKKDVWGTVNGDCSLCTWVVLARTQSDRWKVFCRWEA